MPTSIENFIYFTVMTVECQLNLHIVVTYLHTKMRSMGQSKGYELENDTDR